MYLQQLKGMQSSKQGMWKGYWYHLTIEGVRKGYLFREIKGKGLDLGAKPLPIKICWVPALPPPPPKQLAVFQTNAQLDSPINLGILKLQPIYWFQRRGGPSSNILKTIQSLLRRPGVTKSALSIKT